MPIETKTLRAMISAALILICSLAPAGCATVDNDTHDENAMNIEPAYNIPTDVMSIPNLVEREGEWSVDLIEVNPWYNRMPVMGEDERPAGRRHLVARAVINNQTDQDRKAKLVDAYISFKESELGDPVPRGEFSLIDDSGMPGGEIEKTLKPHSFKNQLRFRGENLFGAGHDNDILYLTIVLQFGDDTVILRRGGNVVVAM